jgi:hypothetical protein
MKPTLDTPDTVVIGLYSLDGRACVTGALRTEAGDLRPDVLAAQGGAAWPALAGALADVLAIGAQHLLVLTNDAAIVDALTPPIRAPAPTATRREYFAPIKAKPEFGFEGAPGYWIDVGYGGDADHWETLRLLAMRWPGRWRCQLVSDLPKARELWEQQ